MLSKERSERESTMMKAQIILVLYSDTYRIENSILFSICFEYLDFSCSLQEIELFMDENEKNDPDKFPRSYRAPMQPQALNHSLANRFLHVIVPKEKVEDSKCDSLL
jgi:hypothetical protein